jgi:hypothetical protein
MSNTTTTYRCQRCGAIDRDHGNNPPVPPALNCYRCHSPGAMLPVPNDTPEEPMAK